MHVQRISDAPQFQAPGHWDMRSLRLQHRGDAQGPRNFGASLSYFLPGGGAGPDAPTAEKVYVVLEGQLQVRVGEETSLLQKFDSCCIQPGTERHLVNPGSTVTTLLVITGRD